MSCLESRVAEAHRWAFRKVDNAVLASETVAERLRQSFNTEPGGTTQYGIGGPSVAVLATGLEVYTVTDAEAERIVGMGVDHILVGNRDRILMIRALARVTDRNIDLLRMEVSVGDSEAKPGY